MKGVVIGPGIRRETHIIQRTQLSIATTFGTFIRSGPKWVWLGDDRILLVVKKGGEQVKERPILFSGPMVRAIREGRKTQTRRIVKPQPQFEFHRVPFVRAHDIGESPQTINCPYGQPRDWLWVKETWRTTDSLDHVKPSNIRPGAQIEYKAGGHNVNGFQGHPLTGMGKWRPSIFMSKWMSRVILEIVSVRVERLKDISGSDCCAEGCKGGNGSIPGYAFSATPREHYRHVWESINGVGSWATNPYVWVIEFKEVKP